jgi:uncharacterized protein YndB with AHSA1/START domain
MENTSQLEVSKEFTCSKEELFKAWTDEEELKQWWKPLNKHLEHVINEIEPGGTVKYVFDNNSLVIDGKYEKVEDNLLEYTWRWHLAQPADKADYKLIVRFEEKEGNSILSVTQLGFNEQHTIEPHKQGWEQALQHLDEFIVNKG